jgi:tetratricopeptide (TPR) repeat protein
MEMACRMVASKIHVERRASPPVIRKRAIRMNPATGTILRITLAVGLATCAFAQTHTTVRHHKEAVSDQPPEIAQAEEAIQKNDFAGAETLLKKALGKDPAKDPNNGQDQAWLYQAWFDLGFVLNQLNRPEESIAAYRKSVAAKSDVFESNLNLGLMLVRANNPDAEQFLRTATTLKPTDHIEEGQARAWLALAHLLESKKPEDAFQAYRKASELTPKDPEPHISAGLLHERLKEFSDAEAEYKQVMTLDPHATGSESTEAAIGLTNIYMKSGRLSDAEPLLRRLAAERPNDAGIHLQLGRVLEAQDQDKDKDKNKDKKDDAIAEIQTARESRISPRQPIAPWRLLTRMIPNCIAVWDRLCCGRRNFLKPNRSF